MKSNNKEVTAKISEHILECTTDNEGNAYKSLKEALRRIAMEFDRVANYPHNINRIPNDQERFMDYMYGLPFGFEFADYKINEFLSTLGLNAPRREPTQEQSNKLYFYLIWKQVSKEYYELKQLA